MYSYMYIRFDNPSIAQTPKIRLVFFVLKINDQGQTRHSYSILMMSRRSSGRSNDADTSCPFSSDSLTCTACDVSTLLLSDSPWRSDDSDVIMLAVSVRHALEAKEP